MSNFVDHTLLQYAFSSVESLSIVQSKGQTIPYIWPWPWKTVFKVTSQYGHFQSKSNMIHFCKFSVTDETKSIVTWKIYTNEFAAKAECWILSQMKGRNHTSVPTVLRVRGVCLERSVKQLANHNILANANSRSRSLYAVARPSVGLSVCRRQRSCTLLSRL